VQVVDWVRDGKVVPLLAQNFEEVLYRAYKPQLPQPGQQPTTHQDHSSSLRSEHGGRAATKSAPTVKDLLIARTAPWNGVPPTVVNAIIERIKDKGLLEAFVMHSMNEGLVKSYERLGGNDPTIISAEISHILCKVGNKTIPFLTKALEAKQQETAAKSLALAGDTFEAAIALAKNQIAAYVGMATLYRLVGKREKCHEYAKRGLAELSASRSGRLVRYDPSGRVERVIDMPVKKVRA
jgi:hypothetical protein